MKRLALVAALSVWALPAPAASPVDQGRYQAVLGDCQGCHGKTLAGGVVLATPFGNLVTPNITPDKDTGIGNYSAKDFRAAMKTGVAKGKLLYPAMPYPAYAHMSDADVNALWAYLKTVKPVRHQAGESHLRFPYNLRFLMRGWNLLFFSPRAYANDGSKSAAWNHGAYLVSGAGHCGTCHSPKNMFGADKSSALSGASLSGWFAPNLTGDRATGLGGWSQDDIVEYLKTGRNAHSIASGPMREAVENSTSQMNDADLNAIAVYLKDLPPTGGAADSNTTDARMAAGAGVYRVACAGCHGLDGAGEKALFPPLAGNSLVSQTSAETLIRVVLEGSRGAATARAPTGPAMPSLGWKLDDRQVADVLTYVRGQWGNHAQAVDADAVTAARAALQADRKP